MALTWAIREYAPERKQHGVQPVLRPCKLRPNSHLFHRRLSKTNLEKIARVSSSDQDMAVKSLIIMEEIDRKAGLRIPKLNFSSWMSNG